MIESSMMAHENDDDVPGQWYLINSPTIHILLHRLTHLGSPTELRRASALRLISDP